MLSIFNTRIKKSSDEAKDRSALLVRTSMLAVYILNTTKIYIIYTQS